MMTTSSSVPSLPRSALTTALFNPTYYLAGGPALVLGLALIVLTALVGSFGNTHTNGVIDVNIGRAAPLWVFVAQGLINWIAVAVPLYVAGRLLSRTRHLRAIDVFGTQALARAPLLLAMFASLVPGFQRAAASLHTGDGGPRIVSLAESPDRVIWVAVLVFAVLMIVWMVALMYRAYATSCNVKGTRAVVSFILALIVGEIVSKVAIMGLLGDLIRAA